jgi:hypothetical protein
VTQENLDGLREDPMTQNYKLQEQPIFDNQRRDNKLDKSLSSEIAGIQNIEQQSFDRLES